MWAELIVLAVETGIYVYHRWIEDHPPTPLPPQVQIPRVSEGSPLPIVYGQCRIRSPILVWSGNSLVPGQTFTLWGPGPNAPGPTETADHYSVDLLFCLGIPFYGSVNNTFTPGTLVGAWAGDTPMGMNIANISGAPAQQFYAAPGQPSDFMVGGVFYRGTTDQNVLDKSSVVPPTIPNVGAGFWPDGVVYDNHATGTSLFAAAKQANADGSIPGCRNQMMLYAHVALGQSTSLPAFQFEVLATQTNAAFDLGNSFSFSIGSLLTFDADPAAVILDMLCSPWGKVGLSLTTLLSQVNVTSFHAASNTLLAEQHGYSRAFEQPADADAMIRDVLAQIDGVLYQEPSTGMLTIKLVRFDYNPATLDDVNPDNAEAAGSGWYTVQGWAEVPNQVRVTYLDRTNNYAETVTIAQDPALIESNGGRIRSVSVRFEGCTNAPLAQQLAARELAAVGRPMVRATVIVDRRFYSKRPGDVVTLTWPELGINKMVMRIAAIDFGMLRSGKIKMSLMRDVFDQKVGAF